MEIDLNLTFQQKKQQFRNQIRQQSINDLLITKRIKIISNNSLITQKQEILQDKSQQELFNYIKQCCQNFQQQFFLFKPQKLFNTSLLITINKLSHIIINCNQDLFLDIITQDITISLLFKILHFDPKSFESIILEALSCLANLFFKVDTINQKLIMACEIQNISLIQEFFQIYQIFQNDISTITLGNIFIFNKNVQIELLNNTIYLIIQRLQNKDILQLPNTLWLLQILTKKTNNLFDQLQLLLNPLSEILMNNLDQNIVQKVLSILKNLADYNELHTKIIELNILDKIIIYIGDKNENIHQLSLQIVGKLSSSDDQNSSLLIQKDVLQYLNIMFDQKNIITRQYVCWIIGNICSCPNEVNNVFYDSSLIFKIFYHLDNDLFEVKKYIYFILRNIIQVGGQEQINYLNQKDILKILSKGLNYCDVELQITVIESIYFLLKRGQVNQNKNPVKERMEKLGIINTIVDLQQHQNSLIYQLSYKIIEEFFNYEEISNLSNDQRIEQNQQVDFMFGSQNSILQRNNIFSEIQEI